MTVKELKEFLNNIDEKADVYVQNLNGKDFKLKEEDMDYDPNYCISYDAFVNALVIYSKEEENQYAKNN